MWAALQLADNRNKLFQHFGLISPRGRRLSGFLGSKNVVINAREQVRPKLLKNLIQRIWWNTVITQLIIYVSNQAPNIILLKLCRVEQRERWLQVGLSDLDQ